MSFMIFNLRRKANESPYLETITPQHYNDLGNLMLAFTMLWAYLNFSQFLIIWAGNIQRRNSLVHVARVWALGPKWP